MRDKTVTIVPATTDLHIHSVSQLAGRIWRQHYPDIITFEQIDYMLDQFQSPVMIREQIENGYAYYLVEQEGQDVGYLAVQEDPPGSLFISKLYIEETLRGQGLGYTAERFIEGIARQQGLGSLWLTVNRHNQVAIAAYQRWGFEITAEVITDIGHDFIMDDYRMEKQLPR